jgi:hypothetical protein
LIKLDRDDNRDLYGREISGREIVSETHRDIPPAAMPFIDALPHR